MKAIAYGVRDDEDIMFNNWSKYYDIDTTLVHENLREHNIDKAKSYDTIIFLAEDTVNSNILKKIKDFGINYIVTRSAGVDNVDLECAENLGIKIANVPSYSPNSVSEYAILSTLSLLRNYHLYIKRGIINDFRIKGLVAREIRNQIIGVVGTGKIGCLTIEHFSGFSPKQILAFDLFEKNEVKRYARYVSLNEIYEKCDIIVYHIPLTSETKYMISKNNIKKMKDGVIIVNVSRGLVMNSKDVLEELKSGKIGGLAMDVYENELPYFRFDYREKYIDDPIFRELLNFPNVIISPHVAFYTDEAVSNMVSTALSNARELYDSGNCKNIIVFNDKIKK